MKVYLGIYKLYTLRIIGKKISYTRFFFNHFNRYETEAVLLYVDYTIASISNIFMLISLRNTKLDVYS